MAQATKLTTKEWRTKVKTFLTTYTDKAEKSTPVTVIFSKFKKYAAADGVPVKFSSNTFGRLTPATYRRQPRKIRGKMCRAFIHRECNY